MCNEIHHRNFKRIKPYGIAYKIIDVFEFTVAGKKVVHYLPMMHKQKHFNKYDFGICGWIDWDDLRASNQDVGFCLFKKLYHAMTVNDLYGNEGSIYKVQYSNAICEQMEFQSDVILVKSFRLLNQI